MFSQDILAEIFQDKALINYPIIEISTVICTVEKVLDKNGLIKDEPKQNKTE